MSIVTPTLFPASRLSPLSKVYFGTDWCNVKIGRSVNPRRRGGELRISILWTVGGGLAEEQSYHRMWASRRIGQSEWFRPNDEMLLWLALNAPDDRARQMVRSLVVSLKRGHAA